MNPDRGKEVLLKQLDRHISRLPRKRKWNKLWAFGLRLTAVFMSGAIAVLLGLKVGEGTADILRNVALALGILALVANAVESFFNHRQLWIQQTITRARLRKLRPELDYYLAEREPQDVKAADIDAFHERMNEVLASDLTSWIRMRKSDDQNQLSVGSPRPRAGESPGQA